MLGLIRLWRDHWKRFVFRAHKDRRSFAIVVLSLVVVAYFALYGVYVYKHPGAIVLLGLAYFVAWRMRKSYARDAESLLRLNTYEQVVLGTLETNGALLKREMLKLWLLFARAGSELFLSQRAVPSNQQVVTRRKVLDKLAELNLRELLSEDELHLHLLPDGQWSRELAFKEVTRAAELEALQYACGFVGSLSPLEDLDKPVKIDTNQLWHVTLSTTAHWRTQDAADIGQQRELSAAFWVRCAREQVSRGIVKSPEDLGLHLGLERASADAGDDNADYLVGTDIISEIQDERLNTVAAQTWSRFNSLQKALTVLRSPAT